MDGGVWQRISRALGGHEKRLRVARVMLRYGLRVGEGTVFLGERIRVPLKSVAEEAGVDRRTVSETLRAIMGDRFLRSFFSGIRPAGSSLVEVAGILGYRCLTVEIHEDRPGILAWVAGALAKRGINIVQVVAEDPETHENPRMYVVTSSNIPGDAIDEILEHPAVKSVTIR